MLHSASPLQHTISFIMHRKRHAEEKMPLQILCDGMTLTHEKRSKIPQRKLFRENAESTY